MKKFSVTFFLFFMSLVVTADQNGVPSYNSVSCGNSALDTVMPSDINSKCH